MAKHFNSLYSHIIECHECERYTKTYVRSPVICLKIMGKSIEEMMQNYFNETVVQLQDIFECKKCRTAAIEVKAHKTIVWHSPYIILQIDRFP